MSCGSKIFNTSLSSTTRVCSTCATAKAAPAYAPKETIVEQTRPEQHCPEVHQGRKASVFLFRVKERKAKLWSSKDKLNFYHTLPPVL